ncbi:hypothetical protein EYR40_005204 [Pleurotus pulmonarius]|nr:hypothetical protein EYR40_005204 [Pleurotus pulmonarius]
MAHMAAAHFEYPQRHPLSPPETNVDSLGTTAMPTPLTQHVPLPSRSVGDPEELGAKLSESPTSRFRRVSTLAYHNSPLRDNRERSSISRTSKPLIIVIPPQALLHECGQLGHTLSQGPPHRLSHGILMPLFPTMYGQLAAIAREFNFPSTSGLCIYYHFSDNGLTSTPRVSDESWQFIWSHVFDERSVVSPPRPPITGKIEFDIDTRQARWYSAWLGTSRRDPLERMSVTPSVIHSIDHARLESKTTFQDDAEDMNETPQRPKGRHVPRKLSLVDRYESMSARSTPASGALLSPPVAAPGAPHHLSPIPQADEPLTAKLDLEKKVTSWRNSATLRPSSLALKGQTSLEPANMPNTLPIDNPPSTEDDMNLEDFHWSVSSQGPPDYDDDTISSVSRLPSVHLAHRAEGSVCLTPSVCTSFGPSDYDSVYSPVSNMDRLPSPDIARRMLDDCPPTPSTATSWGAPLSYPPSPASEHSRLSLDIAHRAVFSRPITPATATSWGAPSWPVSPVYSSRPPSVHMDRRGLASRPLSPIDHESAPWPFVWPYNHHHDVAEGSDADIVDDSDEGVEVPLAPSTRLVWPYEQRDDLATLEVSSQDVPQDVDVLQAGVELMEEDEQVPIETLAPAAAPWNLVWPHSQQQKSAATEEVREIVVEEHKGPWHHVWPYTHSHDEHNEDDENDNSEVPLQSATSSHTWPYEADADDTPVISLHANAHVRLFNHPYSPSFETFSQASQSMSTRETAYPYFLLYPAVYPHFDLYPAVPASRLALTSEKALPTALLGPSYPFNLYNIYPPIAVKLPVGDSKPYPANLYDIYPPVPRAVSGSHGTSKPYPANLYDIYPPVAKAVSRSDIVSKPYPLNLYEIYPDTSLYPGSQQPYPTNLNHIYTPVVLGPTSSSRRQCQAYPMNLYEIYPTNDLYPGCYKPYPMNLAEIYASIPRSTRKKAPSKSKSARPYPSNLHEIYPSLDLYPGCWKPYPANLDEVYRSLTNIDPPTSRDFASISYSAPYPSNLYQIYPSQDLYYGCWKAYPDNLIQLYRPLSGYVLPSSKLQGAIMSSVPYPSNLSQIYPSHDLYPGIWKPYPENLGGIYRPLAGHVIVPPSQSRTSVHGSAPYPINLSQIYPSTDLHSGCWMPYPLNLAHIYRSFEGSNRPKSSIGVVGSPKPYPSNLDDIYPPVAGATVLGSKPYPFNLDEIYPPVAPSRSIGQVVSTEKTKPYPFNLDEIYPAVAIRSTTRTFVSRPRPAAPTINVRFEVRYPVFNLYPAVYPWFDLYPSITKEVSVPGRREMSSSLANVYPYFNLYRPVYPHLEIYPAAYEGKLQLLPPLTRVPKFQVHTTLRHALRPPSVVIQPPTPQHSSEDFAASPPPTLPNPHDRHLQLTHSELHAIVMMESRSRSIFEDDDESPVSPPQPRVVIREPPPVPSLRRPSPSRRSSISQVSPPLVSVSNVETTRQTSTYRNSVTALAQKYSSNTSSTSQSGSPLRRSVSAATPRSPVSPGLIRTRSIGLPSHPAAHKKEMSPTEGPASPPSRLPKRRDSLVLQRVRAYSSQGEKESFLNMDTISEFPLPPRPPTLPSGGRPVR